MYYKEISITQEIVDKENTMNNHDHHPTSHNNPDTGSTGDRVPSRVPLDTPPPSQTPDMVTKPADSPETAQKGAGPSPTQTKPAGAEARQIQAIAAGREQPAGVMQPPEIAKARPIANRLSHNAATDIILFNGKIDLDTDTEFIDLCSAKRHHQKAILILVTFGGYVEPAYRIARCLQTMYSEYSMFISGYCKSAGTLLATSAHELIFSDYGELGPLDAQMPLKDELGELRSGLTIMDTFSALQQKAFDTFDKFFLQIKERSISTTRASQIATKATTGLFAPLYGQIDPMHLGESTRAMRVRNTREITRRRANISIY